MAKKESKMDYFSRISNNFLEFNLEIEKEIEEDTPGNFYGVRYYNTEKGPMVEIGDFRHELLVEAKYWNRIVEIIREDKLDKMDVEAITRGLMGLPKEYERNFISAVKKGKVNEILI